MDLWHRQRQVQGQALDPDVSFGQSALETLIADHSQEIRLQHPEATHAGDALEDDTGTGR